MSPKERLDAVKDTLRGMGLHGMVDQIDTAVSDLQAIHAHTEGAFRGEVLRLRAENARLREVNKSMEAKIHGQRAVIRSLQGKAVA